MSKALYPDGREVNFTNLGWLINNRNKHGGVRWVDFAELVDQSVHEAVLTVDFFDGTLYTCGFASLYVLLDWIQAHLWRWMSEDNKKSFMENAWKILGYRIKKV